MLAQIKRVRFLLFCLIIVSSLAGCGGGGGGGDVSGTPDDTSAPTTPTGLTAQADSSTIILLSWNAASDNVAVLGYRIYRGGAMIQDLFSPASLEFEDKGLTPNTTYAYTISAYDSVGNESAQSAVVQATTFGIRVVQFGTTADDEGDGVGVDSSGNVYVAGITTGTLGMASYGGQDYFVRKYDPDKNLLWTVQFGSATDEQVHALAVDPGGNSYVAGSTEGDLTAVPHQLRDAFLVKYDSAGTLQWIQQPSTSFYDEAWAVAVDSDNSRVYVAGGTNGSFSGPNAGQIDIFLIQYDLDGIPQWTRQLGTSANDIPFAAAVDGSGNVYLTGQTLGDLDGAGPGTLQGYADAFLVKYNSSGDLLWVTQWGTADYDDGDGVAVDGAGNIYVTGTTYGALGASNAGGADLYLAKFDASGNQLWIRQTGSSNEDYTRAVGVNGSGNVYVTGSTLGVLSDPGEGGSDLFLVVYDSSGALQGKTQGGSSGNDEGDGIAIDPGNNCLYLTGATDGGVDGNANLGGRDALLIKLGFDGELL